MTGSSPTLQPTKLSRPHQNEPETPASRLVVAIEAVWAEIRRRHPDVPPVIVTVGAGSIGARPGTLRLGHYASARWRPATRAGETPAVAELFIAGEGLAHGPVEVLGTLLHEAAHGVATTRAVKDTSRAGAYHNKRYRALAAELGLQIDRHPTIGWSTTTVPAATAAAYTAQVEQLRAAIAHVRESEHHARRAGPGGAARRQRPRHRRARARRRGRRRALGADIPVRVQPAAAAADGAHRLRPRRRRLRRLRAALHRRLTRTRREGGRTRRRRRLHRS